MKTEKLSMAGVKNVLSREELKEIMAGSGVTCNNPLDCQLAPCCPGYWCESIGAFGGVQCMPG
jgi:hypothetical protein